MVKAYIPKYEDLWFRQKLLANPETMAYNHAWGGTVSFPEEKWDNWYNKWIVNAEGRFYRYLVNEEDNEFVGEIAYHYDKDRKINIADIIVLAKYRGMGFGKQGLRLLCEFAKNNGIDTLYDNIAIENSSVELFLKNGFFEEYRTEEFIMLKKDL